MIVFIIAGGGAFKQVLSRYIAVSGSIFHT